MTKQCSIAETKDNLSQLLREVEKGLRVQVTRRGKPVAFLVPASEGIQAHDERASFEKALREFRRKHRVDKLNIDPNKIFADVRDRSLGRDVDL